LITAGADEETCCGNIQGKNPYGVASPPPPTTCKSEAKCHMTVSACFCLRASLPVKKTISLQAFSLRTREIFFTFLLFEFNRGVLMTNIEEI